MTKREKAGLGFILPGIACFLVARLPRVEDGALNVVLTFAGLVLVVVGLLRMRKIPDR